MARTVEEIQVEYGNLCTKAGHVQYQISALKVELDAMNARLLELNKEAAEVSKPKEEKSE